LAVQTKVDSHNNHFIAVQCEQGYHLGSDVGEKSSRKGEGGYCLLWESITELQSVTCHMGSHSITCHPTQVNDLTPAMQASTLFTYPGGMEG